MKKVILAALAVFATTGIANATDLYSPSLKDESAPAESRNMWTGFSMEAGLGVGMSEAELDYGDNVNFLDANATSGASDVVGHIGLGYDYMFAPGWVIGILGRMDMSQVEHEASLGFGPAKIVAKGDSETISWLVGGRLGYAFAPNWMAYGLVGYKFANDMEYSVALSPCAGCTAKVSKPRNGWVLGAGLETMINSHWFLGAEYTATLVDSETLATIEDGGYVGKLDVDGTDHAAKVRFGYRF